MDGNAEVGCLMENDESFKIAEAGLMRVTETGRCRRSTFGAPPSGSAGLALYGPWLVGLEACSGLVWIGNRIHKLEYVRGSPNARK